MCSMMAFAQKKETIEIKRTKESWLSSIREIDWYLEQIKAWKEAVDADQKDEWAWRNYYCATDGMYTNGYGKEPDKSESAKILRKMEAAIPDSYILNLCKCRFSEVADSVASKRVDFVRRAAQLYQMQNRKNIDDGDIHYLLNKTLRQSSSPGKQIQKTGVKKCCSNGCTGKNSFLYALCNITETCY